MRKHLKELVQIFADKMPEPIYEFGSLQVEGQEGFADLRQYFKGKEYIGCDYRAGLGVDKVLDVTNIDLPDNSVGAILCLDTMEHVCDPKKAVEEMYRVLRPDGVILLTTVMDFPIHSYPYDYYRFTQEGIKYLFKSFENGYNFSCGNKLKPHTVGCFCWKKSEKIVYDKDDILKIMKWCKKSYNPYKWTWILRLFNQLKPWKYLQK